MFNVVLVEPEIPPNTGNVARLCLATGSRLHLVEPLGFSTDDRALKRAGLDYWKEVEIIRWPSLAAFDAATAAARRHLLTTKASRTHFAAAFRPDDYLIFGRETKGLPEPFLRAHSDCCLAIPMRNQTRSLNLATAVGIVLYEGIRQNPD